MFENKRENKLPHGCAHVVDTVDETEDARSTVTPAASIGSISFIEVPLNERLADNPISVRHSVSELDGLEASIRTRGILQPLIVARAEVFRSARPETSVETQAEWVLLAGHRRRAAARRAGIKTAIAIVRDDLVKSEDSATVALIENVHRAGLGPLEEARALSVLRDLSLSQREISDQTGISQGQVSKRLQLLELPVELQDRIDDGGLTVADALTVLHELNDPQDQLRALRLSQGGGRSLKRVLTQLKREQTARNVAEQRSGQEDKILGVGVERTGHNDCGMPAEWQRPEVSADTAVIEPKLVHEGKGADPRENREILDQHTAACSARVEACLRAVQSRLSVEQIAEVLVDATLDPPVLRSDQVKDQAHSMAAEWAATILPKGLDASVPSDVLRSAREAAQRLAVAIVFAHREIDLASAERLLHPWHEAARRHVRRLAAWGLHTPTAYEDTRLAQSSANEGSDCYSSRSL